MTDDVVVRCRNIHKRFGRLEVLKGIDMDLHQGEVVVIFGRSGFRRFATGRRSQVSGRGSY